MPKFNKGDRIVTKSGVHGTVLTVLDGNYYAVQFDGRELSKVHESMMKAENSCALNSKFKVGDKVTDGDAVYLITGVTGLDYIWKCISGTPNPHWSKGGEKEWAEEQVEIVNSCVKNAEAKDSKGNILKDGDYAVATVGPLKGKRVEIISVHSRANIYVQDDTGAIKIIDGAYLVKNNACGCAVNSTREIVQKALNRKATNADAAPTYIGNGVYKVGDIVNYNGSAWKVVSKSQLGIGNGQALIAYGLKSTKTGVIVKGVPEHNISPKNTLIAPNADAVSPENIQREVAADLTKLDKRTTDEIAKQVESFCYWMESNIGRQVEYYKRIIKENGITDAKITAQLSAIEKHVKSVCDQAKRIK